MVDSWEISLLAARIVVRAASQILMSMRATVAFSCYESKRHSRFLGGARW